MRVSINSRVVKARSDYTCQSDRCLLESQVIGKGTVCVTVHDSTPKQGPRGQALSHIKHNHYQVRYHVACFFNSERCDKGAIVSYEAVDELEGTEENIEEAKRVLAEYQRNPHPR